MAEIGFYLLTAIMLILSAITIAKYNRSILRSCVIIVMTWLAYVIVVSELGWLYSTEFPPRVPLLIILPSFIIILVLTAQPQMKRIMISLPTITPIFVQSFRIVVELLIYQAFLEGAFPETVSFSGTNFDILVGLSAIPVGLLYRKKRLGNRGLFIWNILSLIILTGTGYTFVNAYYISNIATTEQIAQFVTIPYLLLPAILLPMAFLFHIISIRQLLNMRKYASNDRIVGQQ